MKNGIKLFLLGICFWAVNASAQIETPAASPGSKVEQKIGLTTVNVEYSRPSVKGRSIFGASDDHLVAYGSMWRTGANRATKITFSEDVMIEGNTVPKGTYAILSVPGADSWKVNFYDYDSGSWGTYKEKTPATSVMVKPVMTKDMTETFTIDFQNIMADKASMHIKWANTAVPVTIGVKTDEAVMAAIDRVMAGPSNDDYYNAANYYYTSGKDLNKALSWIQKATSVENPKFWQVRREALILAELGRKQEAIKAAMRSKDLAQAAGNMEYVKMNEKSIAEWK